MELLNVATSEGIGAIPILSRSMPQGRYNLERGRVTRATIRVAPVCLFSNPPADG